MLVGGGGGGEEGRGVQGERARVRRRFFNNLRPGFLQYKEVNERLSRYICKSKQLYRQLQTAKSLHVQLIPSP